MRVAVVAAESAAPIEHVVRALPERSGFAIVVFCHADAQLGELLRSASMLPVIEVRGRIRLEPDKLFVVPSDCDGTFQRDELIVAPVSEPRVPIDRMLRS